MDFGFSNERKRFDLIYHNSNKSNFHFFVRFFGEVRKTKIAFEINWPLVKLNFFDQFLEELRIPKSSFEIKWPLLEWGVEVIFEGTWAPVFSGPLYFYFRYYKLCTYFVSPVWKLYNPYCHIAHYSVNWCQFENVTVHFWSYAEYKIYPLNWVLFKWLH